MRWICDSARSTTLRVLAGCIFGCALLPTVIRAQSVRVDFDPSVDLAAVHTYEWRTHPLFEKRPELKQLYSVAIGLVMGDANEQLMKKHINPVDAAPDVYLTFFVGSKEVQETRTDVIDTWGGWYGWYMAPVWTVTTTEKFVEGTLVMDMVDAHTSQLIWRAYCSDTIRDMKDRHKNIDSAVRKAFDHFPPKQKR